jgi:transcriptional regulator with XRE-family HTH domain
MASVDKKSVKEKTNDYCDRAKALGITLSKLAHEAGVDYITLYRWRTGERIPTLIPFSKMAEFVEAEEAKLPPHERIAIHLRGVKYKSIRESP